MLRPGPLLVFLASGLAAGPSLPATVVPEPFDGADGDPPDPPRLDRAQAHTLGQWGPDSG